MSDWWAQRLGGGNRAPQAPPQQQTWQPQQPNNFQQQYPPQQPQAPKVTMHNLIEAMAAWKGGPGARGSARCPECGSPHMFDRGPNMAPQCYECGANPRFAPQGQPRG